MYIIHLTVLHFILINVVYGQFMPDQLMGKATSAEALTPWLTISEVRTSTHRTIKTYKTNMQTEMVRRTTTQPHVMDKTCMLKPDIGPCRAMIQMWYFDPKTKNCSTFKWGGCQGNGNRFDRSSECFDTCLSKRGWKASRPRYCSLNFDYGWCFGAVERWYYDHRWGVCKKTIYSGCGGNKNNFYNKEKCDDVCRLAVFALKPITKSHQFNKVLIVDPIQLTTGHAGPRPTEG